MGAKWYLGTGVQNDVIISTSIHLVRNLREFPFPHMLSLQDKLKVNAIIKEASDSLEGYCFNYLEMKTLSQYEVVSLAERHLVSPEFASSRDGRALLITDDESVSVMLNEDDHIRFQVMYAAFSLDEAYKTANKIDNSLSSKLNFAFDERIGYLTQDPTIIGTGMKASVSLHLPGLVSLMQIPKLISTVQKLGLTLRGSYGEGASAKGDMFQLSNSITLGISEKAAIENLKSIALQIAAQERAAREELLKLTVTEDKIFRAYGVLKYARLIDTDELMDLLSLVRLGAVKGLINIDTAKIEGMMINLQPATISLSVDRPLDRNGRDALRAQRVREMLG
ncbi:MAG: ATP--guanido phosphotransferase [Clostridia bacterium]|nr:ATP--guanido phosphotransferase [Clostridia bacterium]